MKISGFSIIRNGEKLGYPFIESICSILPICDEFVIAVGNSEDATREKIVAINSPKIRIIDTVWDETLREGGRILAQQTDVAFDHITGDWGFYIQGDEVFHEQFFPVVLSAMRENLDYKEVDGLLLNYKHFYGSYQFVGTAMKWYRKEIRIIKNDNSIRSYGDAQGFRKAGKKLKVKQVAAEMYHYGWCRPPVKQQLKQLDFNKLYHTDDWIKNHVVQAEQFDYHTFDALQRFEGTHPLVMYDLVKNSNFTFAYDSSKVKIKFKDRIRILVEKLTGYRLWEYKNYELRR